MDTEKKTEKEVVSPKVLVNPFFNKRPVVVQPKLDDPNVYKVVSMEVDHDTLLATPVYEAVDSVKEIQACKDLCGLEYMKKLLASGQVSAEDLADSKPTDVDLTVIPSDVHQAKRAAEAINQDVSKTMTQLGAKDGKAYTKDEVEALIASATKYAYEKAQAEAAEKASAEGAQQ